MAHFAPFNPWKEKYASTGFDERANWLIMQEGWPRLVYLIGGQNLQVTCSPKTRWEIWDDPTGLSNVDTIDIDESFGSFANNRSRAFNLFPHRVGTYVLEANTGRWGDAPRATLEIEVRKARSVNFHYWHAINDNGMGENTDKSYNIHDIHYKAASILHGAAVDLSFLGFSYLSTYSLPSELDLDHETRVKLIGEGNDARADLQVYLVWYIKKEKPHTITNGLTLGNMSLIVVPRRTEEAIASTLAHELGHFLSYGNGPEHDAEKESLMYSPAPHGTMLRKDRILRFHGDLRL